MNNCCLVWECVGLFQADVVNGEGKRRVYCFWLCLGVLHTSDAILCTRNIILHSLLHLTVIVARRAFFCDKILEPLLKQSDDLGQILPAAHTHTQKSKETGTK